MTTLTAAKQWNCSVSWVRHRCKEGMIPLAEKNGIWDIPDTADKPPCTRHRAVVLMKLLQEKSEGNDVELFPGNDMDTFISIYMYLSGNGFITRLKGKKVEKEIGNAKVLNAGIALITSESEDRKERSSKKSKISAELNTKHFKVGIEYEVTSAEKAEG